MLEPPPSESGAGAVPDERLTSASTASTPTKTRAGVTHLISSGRRSAARPLFIAAPCDFLWLTGSSRLSHRFGPPAGGRSAAARRSVLSGWGPMPPPSYGPPGGVGWGGGSVRRGRMGVE